MFAKSKDENDRVAPLYNRFNARQRCTRGNRQRPTRLLTQSRHDSRRQIVAAPEYNCSATSRASSGR